MYEAHLYSLNLDTSLFLYMSSISSCEPISFCDYIYIITISVCQSWKFEAHSSSKKFPLQGATPHFKVETWISYLSKSRSLNNFLYGIAKSMCVHVAFSISYPSDLLCCLSEKLHLLEECMKSIALKWRRHRASDLL